MRTYIKSILILIAGMMAFQIISTIQVYLSNLNLYTSILLIKEAGYLTIPNALEMESLKSVKPAFCGAVFFSLSIGTMTTLFSFLAAHLYHRFHKKKIIITGFVSIIFCLIFTINSKGFCFIETLSFIITPSIVFILFELLLKNDNKNFELKKIWLHTIPILVLACILLLSSGTSNSRIFSDFRDNFLLSNSAGMKINDFYYNYTLYPAQVFKSLKQKVLKTAYIDDENNTDELINILENKLALYDYLVISDKSQADLVINISGDVLTLAHNNKAIVETPIKIFLRGPEKALVEFSQKTDTFFYYRKITGISLISGLPLFMYIMMHFVFSLIFSCIRFIRIRNAGFTAIIASVCCFTVGLSGFAVLTLMKAPVATHANLTRKLNSKIMKERVEGLKFICEKSLDISRYPATNGLMTSPHVLERYWYARAAGSDRTAESYDRLLQLLDDVHPNVVCQAFYGLGKKKDRKAIPEIIQRIQLSKNWYAQWYAYRALKRLGWIQKKSK